MLRHFKMEMLKRQQEELARSLQQPTDSTTRPRPESESAAMPTTAVDEPALNQDRRQLASDAISAPSRSLSEQRKPAAASSSSSSATKKVAAADRASRARSRRASKPQMEKRRRARINECLDILKSYVLTDSNNLSHLGIDPAARENQDEETIARTILKSSGLIHRHRGRKNPNKLEKADILELTVDYVRRLHDQRNELLLTSHSQNGAILPTELSRVNTNQAHNNQQQMVVPAHLSECLTLDLSPKSRVLQQHFVNGNLLVHARPHTSDPLTPPPSSASSMQGSVNDDGPNPQMLLSQAIENYKLYDRLLPYQQQQQQQEQQQQQQSHIC